MQLMIALYERRQADALAVYRQRGSSCATSCASSRARRSRSSSGLFSATTTRSTSTVAPVASRTTADGATGRSLPRVASIARPGPRAGRVRWLLVAVCAVLVVSCSSASRVPDRLQSRPHVCPNTSCLSILALTRSCRASPSAASLALSSLPRALLCLELALLHCVSRDSCYARYLRLSAYSLPSASSLFTNANVYASVGTRRSCGRSILLWSVSLNVSRPVARNLRRRLRLVVVFRLSTRELREQVYLKTLRV